MFLAYNILLTLLAPIWGPWMWLRTRMRKVQPNWKERCGDYEIAPRKDRKRIWFHAVSVGEVIAALPILQHLRKALPEHEILLSVTTSSGHQTALDKAVGLYDHLVYFPIDVARFQLAAMQHAQPSVVAVMETELWMNFLWAAKVFDVRTLLVNGRISDRSFRRSRLVSPFYRSLLLQMDRCLMQSEQDANRILELGGHSVETVGNCKFDQAQTGAEGDPSHWRSELGLDPKVLTIVVGSTRGELEERFVLEALALVANLNFQVVHAPRHIERVPSLAEEVRAKFGVAALRSRHETGKYLILDSYGELDQVYGVADIVVIGGGFENLGGQNLLQPLAHGKPVLHGPFMHNFRDVAAAAVNSGASQICGTPQELAAALRELLEDPERRGVMGAAASALVQANLGASERYASAIAAEALAFQP